MKSVRASKFFGWRRPVGWLASYALVLHVLFAGVAGGQLTAQAAEQNWSFFEICYGQGGDAGDFSGEVPNKHNSKSTACAFCASGGHAVAPDAQEVAQVRAAPVRAVVWRAETQSVRAFSSVFFERQRGPPFAA